MGFATKASGGTMGRVRNVLFDDVAWRVRRMVVHTGPWLGGRIALVQPSDIGQAERLGWAIANIVVDTLLGWLRRGM